MLPGRPTCHSEPWALILRNGNTPGKRLNTRMAYLTGTITGPDGKAVAMKGYIMNCHMKGWSKHARRVEWSDVVKRWSRQPAPADIRKAKQTLPVAE